MTQHPDLFDEGFLTAIADPVRLRILTTLEERPSTTAELAADAGLSPGEIDDHLHLLAARDLVEPADDHWRSRRPGWIKLTELLRDVGPGT